MHEASTYFIAALYRFTPLPGFEGLKAPLEDLCAAHRICGSLLLASEGINGTIAGTEAGVRAVLGWLEEQPGLGGLPYKTARAARRPFRQMKVRLKREIVSMGVPGVDPATRVGTYVEPAQWNALITDPTVRVIDTRNDYETDIGTFEGATCPETDSFTEFPDWARANLPDKKERIAMFCTGGIRCEKATSWLVEQGYEAVFHLEGGILKYLKETAPEESLWAGECFVFDERVSVNHALQPGEHTMCPACGWAVTPRGRASPDYVEGVSCPRCVRKTTLHQKARFKERQRQIELAETRAETHLASLPETIDD